MVLTLPPTAALPVPVSCSMRSHLLWKAKVKAEAQVDTGGELHWNARNTLVFPAICTLAGIMAGAAA